MEAVRARTFSEIIFATPSIMAVRRFLPAGILSVVLVHLAITYSSQPPAGYTGAPGENTCSRCHSGDYRPGQGITLILDTDTLSPSGMHFYTPGDTHTFIVYLDIPGARNGFELTALNQSHNATGTFILLNTVNTSLQSVGGRWYVGHRSAGSTSWWQFLWVAPAVADTVTFYVTGNAANGNNTAGGDTIYAMVFTVYPAVSPPPSSDLTVAGIVSPEGEVLCPDSTYQLIIQLLNTGTDTADSFHLSVLLNGLTIKDTTVVANLFPDSSMELLVGGFAFGAPTDTLLVVASALPSDASPANDTLTVVFREFSVWELSLSLPALATNGDTLTLQLGGAGVWLADMVRWRLSGTASVSQDTFTGVGPHGVVVGAPSGEDTLFVQVSVLVCGAWYVLFDTVVVSGAVTGVGDGKPLPVDVRTVAVGNMLVVRGTPPGSTVRLLSPTGRVIASGRAKPAEWVVSLPLPEGSGVYLLEVVADSGELRAVVRVLAY